MKAIIVWHYYENGKIVDYSTTQFQGSEEQLMDCLKNDDTGKPTNIGKKDGERVIILHQIVFL